MEKRAKELKAGDIFIWRGLDCYNGLAMIVREVLLTRKGVRVKYDFLGANDLRKRECGFHHEQKVDCPDHGE